MSKIGKEKFKMKIQSLLVEEVTNQIGELNKMEVGDEKYKTAVDGIAKLTDRAIEMERLELERSKQFDENRVETMKANDESKDRKWRNGIAIGGAVLTAGLTIWGTHASFKFEKDGTITTIMGRGFIQKLLPRK